MTKLDRRVRQIETSREDVSSSRKSKETNRRDDHSPQAKLTQYQLKTHGKPEADKDGKVSLIVKQESDNLETVLRFLLEKPAVDICRLKQYRSTQKRLGGLLVTVRSIWDERKILSK